MNAEIITIGTELLLGQILDTNSLYLSKKLAEIGINLYYKTSVGDNITRIKETLSIAANRSDLIIITGGLGPTVDDVTRDAIAEWTGKKLLLDNEVLHRIEQFFKNRNIKMPENNKLQAYLPEGALILENKVGTAPGFILEHNSRIIACVPGVPAEMKPMIETGLIPYLIEKYGAGKFLILSKRIKLTGIPESLIDEKIKDIFIESKNPTVAILAHQTEIEIRLTAKAENKEQAISLIENLKREIYNRLSDNIFGEDDETLEEKVAILLKDKKLTIATAESCTAGLLSYRLTNIPGSSLYFLGGVNTYSNESKINLLGVKEETIKKYGAVSEECARQMAQKCREKFGSDIAIAISGIAGPDGGTVEKPVGLVYMAIDFKGDIKIFKFNFGGLRDVVRARASQMALFELYKLLKTN
ncbi:MAG: competence/damage-inducible protein A [Candidatus Goldbacteria bacterium]|nr:competence/damage-inducible protein A [Candidatus Goldiibacteriota bacterium]